MKAVFIGASALTVMAARIMLKRNHEVVVVERDRTRIEAVADELDCGFIHGDGAKPAVLRETDPAQTDVLYCLTDNDQANIIASLVGRSLGFARVVTKIEDPEFEHICIELGLESTIVPTRTTGGYLADMFEGRDPLELSTMIRYDARVFSFVARAEDAVPIAELDLPRASRVVCLYRDNTLLIPDDSTRLRPEDEVILVTNRDNLPALEQRWTSA
jgi:trk system potassium uptake protein TrkA